MLLCLLEPDREGIPAFGTRGNCYDVVRYRLFLSAGAGPTATSEAN